MEISSFVGSVNSDFSPDTYTETGGQIVSASQITELIIYIFMFLTAISTFACRSEHVKIVNTF